MAGRFENKVVLITGSSGNLGSAAARRFAQEGASLALVDRNAERIGQFAATLAAEFNIHTEPLSGDIGNPESVASLIAQAVSHFGRIDVLVHTVGGYAASKSVAEADLDILDHMFALNVRPLYLMCGKVAAHMLERGGGGRIIVVLARASEKGTAHHSAYAASKAAGQRITESLSAEVRDQGIGVNAVSPSTIDTPTNRESMPNADFSKWVTADSLAATIAFLASDDASSLHGVTLDVFNRS